MNEKPNSSITLLCNNRIGKEHHEFVFELTTPGCTAMQMTVAIDRHFPDESAESVARTFLYRRLLEVAHVAERRALSDAKMKEIWSNCKPAHYP